MDVPLLWKELARMSDLGRRGSGLAGAECCLFFLRAPLLFDGYLDSFLGTVFIGTTKIASGMLFIYMELRRGEGGGAPCELASQGAFP
eukprot:1159258-Pelagomonas_calceolata.AAC.11